MTQATCPRPEVLGKYVMGSMSAAEMQALEQHLIECQTCCDHAETLNPHDEVTQAFGLPSKCGEIDDMLLNEVIQRVVQLHSAVEETLSIQNSDSFSAQDDPDQFEFETAQLLSAAVGPEELGRLGGYRVLKLLGRGGMGFVFLAEDIQLRRRVALKVMRPSEARKRGAKERFLREARAAAAVDHDNVVAIHQVGEDRGIPFIAMPMLQGESLRSVLERESSLPQERAITIAKQVAAGLYAAHQTGLIHRDIKPDNLWLDAAKDRVKILDFGLVRELGSEDGLTIHGTVLGTPSYMSPEQAAGDTVDQRSDLFSLGAVLYQMLCGTSPYAGSNLTSTLMNVARAQPQPIQSLIQGLDDELVSLVSKLNSRESKDRPQSAAEVVEALERIQLRLSAPKIEISDASTQHMLDPSHADGPPKSIWLNYSLGAGGAAILLLAVTLFVQMGKYQVQITLDDPAIALKVDGKDILIEDDKAVTRLSAGPHRLTVERDGLSTVTDEFTVKKDGKNVIHVSVVEGSLAIDQNANSSIADAAKTIVAMSPSVQNPLSASQGSASLDLNEHSVDAPERRAATWMRSVKPPISFRLMSLHDANRQWDFLPEATDSIPSEPFRIYTMYLLAGYTDKFQDATADDLAPHIQGIRNLEALRIGGDKMTSSGVAKLLELPELKDVLGFDIGGSQFDDQMFGAVAKLPQLTQVTFANVPKMTGTGVGALKACSKLTSLGWTLASPSVESFEELSQLPQLSSLELNGIQCSESHVKAIAKLKLRSLFLYNSGLDDAKVKHLAKLTELVGLNISVGQITDAGLAELQVLKELQFLDIRGTLVTVEGLAEFKKAVPDCKVITDLPQPDA